MKQQDGLQPRKQNPERFSGHKLVDYLIANPDAQGNFKWDTLRSCMWRRLLTACPQYAPYSEPYRNKILRNDVKKILRVQWQLLFQLNTESFNSFDWEKLVIEHPELADHIDLDKLIGYSWANILKVHPQLAPKCDWEKITIRGWCELFRKHPEFSVHCPLDRFNARAWVDLLTANSTFADRCPWKLFSPYDWYQLIRVKPGFLACYTLEHFSWKEDYFSLLEASYAGTALPPHGMFEDFSGEAAVYLLTKTMDPVNGAKYLKKQYAKENWAFLEEICDASPEELLCVPGKKQIPFLIALKAPDSLFYKFFRSVDPSLRDRVGNTLLHSALMHDLCSGSGMERYEFMLEHGCDPDAKNDAGFSSNDLKKHIGSLPEKPAGQPGRTGRK